jgi:hypothetical protein
MTIQSLEKKKMSIKSNKISRISFLILNHLKKLVCYLFIGLKFRNKIQQPYLKSFKTLFKWVLKREQIF